MTLHPEVTILDTLLQTETELELSFLEDADFRKGLIWGQPRHGHPEGQIYKHILEVNANIDRLAVSLDRRRQLRIISFVHDTFKYCERYSVPRDWSRHHGRYARQFLERYIEEEAVLEVTEWHDEAYYAWRNIFLRRLAPEGHARMERLLARMTDHLQLYYEFFVCDTLTGDKTPAPIDWFEETVTGLEPIVFVS